MTEALAKNRAAFVKCVLSTPSATPPRPSTPVLSPASSPTPAPTPNPNQDFASWQFDKPDHGASTITAGAAPRAAIAGGWDTAPTCSPGMQPTAHDANGNPWGWDAGRSCACRDQPKQSSQPTTDKTAINAGDWNTAPACGINVQPTKYDDNGRPWGYEEGRPCACRHMQQPDLSGSTAGMVSWEAAPTCSPGVQPTARDANGRSWGWDVGRSCACRDQPKQSSQPTTDNTAIFAGNWNTAPACGSNVQPTKYDDNGRPWGYEEGRPCACRHMQQPELSGSAAGDVLWDTAPTCSPGVQPTAHDANGRAWGWDAGRSCACRDQHTGPPQPAPTSQPKPSAQSSHAATDNTATTAGDWDTAPSCGTDVHPTKHDNDGRPWGVEDGRLCACHHVQQPDLPATTSGQNVSRDHSKSNDVVQVAPTTSALQVAPAKTSDTKGQTAGDRTPITWHTAATCPPGTPPSVYDAEGMPWAWSAPFMCACLDAPKKDTKATAAGAEAVSVASPKPRPASPSPSSPSPAAPTPAPANTATTGSVAQAVSTGGNAVATALSTSSAS
jgi:hypothetical protein